MSSSFNLNNEDELIEALKRGAVVLIGPDGMRLAAHDDLPADMRECIRFSRAVSRIPTNGGVLDMSAPGAQAAMDAWIEHKSECPSCLEAEAESTLMDAAAWREDESEELAKRERIAQELEAEAHELNAKAARIRSAQEAQS